MKIYLIIFFTILLQFCVAAPTEKDLYLTNVEKAFNFSISDEHLEIDQSLYQEIKELFLQIYEKEKIYPNFIHCLTAQDSIFYVYQVVAKELYRKLFGKPRKHFEFLRFPKQNLSKNREEFFARYPFLIHSKEELAKVFSISSESLEDGLKAHEVKDEEVFLKISSGGSEEMQEDDEEEDNNNQDNEELSLKALNDINPQISKELVSVNFTMETYRPLDSAMFVFVTNRSVVWNSASQNNSEYEQKFAKILHELFDFLNLPKEKLEACIRKLIRRAPRTKFGIINQIFLPKEKAADHLYFSFGLGFLHPLYDSNIEESYQEFQRSQLDQPFRTFRNFQARIIAGSLFENPRIKIYRYTLIPKEKQKQYEAFVRKILNELIPAAGAF